MATQRIASASARGSASKKALNNGSLVLAAPTVNEISGSRRWKSTPAIGINSSVTSQTGDLFYIVSGFCKEKARPYVKNFFLQNGRSLLV